MSQCYNQGGRLGDILNLLPGIAKYDNGSSTLVVDSQYMFLAKAVDYCHFVTGMAPEGAILTKVDGHPIQPKVNSFCLAQWEYAGFPTNEYSSLRLPLQRPIDDVILAHNKYTSQEVIYNFEGFSSPFVDGKRLGALLNWKFGAYKLPTGLVNPLYLLNFMAKAKILVTADTATVHLANHFSHLKVIVLSEGMGFGASQWRDNWIYHGRYRDWRENLDLIYSLIERNL